MARSREISIWFRVALAAGSILLLAALTSRVSSSPSTPAPFDPARTAAALPALSELAVSGFRGLDREHTRWVIDSKWPELDIEAIRAGEPARPAITLDAVDLRSGRGRRLSGDDAAQFHWTSAFEDSKGRWQIVRDTESEGRSVRLQIQSPGLPRGIRLGVVGMREGGVRLLRVPAEWAYGDVGRDPVPPGATQVFALRIVSIE
jgi:FKBP-type peptidyl-prolyl cis-trans isomerase FkpA